MTGKELLLVLVGAATAAGAGGMAAATLMNDAPADDGAQTAVLEKLDRLGTALEDTNSILTESRDEIGGLRGRLEAVEAGMYGRRALPAATESGRRRVDVARHVLTTVEEVGDGRSVDFSTSFEGTEDEMQAHMKEALKGLKMRLGEGGQPTSLGRIIGENGEIVGLTGALEGLQRSFELRALPEAERWDKAREEVGLNDTQVEEIQAALDERDEAIEASMVVERDDDDGSSRISVRNLDFAKTREANAAYEKRVDNVLNDEQKKAWKEKGFKNAFGRGAMGTATVISIGTMSNEQRGDK